MRKKILFFQFRKDNKMIIHEKKCLLNILDSEFKKNYSIKFVNLFDKKDDDYFKNELIFKKYNYFIFGGSSEFGLADETSYPIERKIILKKTKRLINYLIEKNFPTLGICFGHQLIAIHLGAKVVRNLNKKEVGTYIVSIKDGYEKDKIFNNIKKKFYAQFAHIDFIYEDSKNKKIISIAKTQNDNFSMFKFKTNVYGVQFHPELSKKTFIERLLISSENEYKKKKFKLKESPMASLIIKNFLSIKT